VKNVRRKINIERKGHKEKESEGKVRKIRRNMKRSDNGQKK
jgi:hypothetical protein